MVEEVAEGAEDFPAVEVDSPEAVASAAELIAAVEDFPAAGFQAAGFQAAADTPVVAFDLRPLSDLPCLRILRSIGPRLVTDWEVAVQGFNDPTWFTTLAPVAAVCKSGLVLRSTPAAVLRALISTPARVRTFQARTPVPIFLAQALGQAFPQANQSPCRA